MRPRPGKKRLSDHWPLSCGLEGVALLEQALIAGQREGAVRTNIDPAAAAAILFEIGWAIVRAELEGEAALPLDRALLTLNEIIGLGLLPRQR